MASENFMEWVTPEKLVKVRGMRRDGYTIRDVCKVIGISQTTLRKWREESEEFDAAIREGKQVLDYKVEDALIKSALGYSTKEVKVTEIFRYGKLVERQKEVYTHEVAPNVQAIQTYLYNRLPEKWKKNRDQLVELEDEDGGIQITVTRAGGTVSDSREEAEILPEPGSPEDMARVNGSVTVEPAEEDLRSMERQQEELIYGPDEEEYDEEYEDQ